MKHYAPPVDLRAYLLCVKANPDMRITPWWFYLKVWSYLPILEAIYNHNHEED